MIKLIKKSSKALERELNSIFEELDRENTEYELQQINIKKVVHLIQTSEIEKINEWINDNEQLKKFNYANLSELHDRIKALYDGIHELKEQIDLDKFYKNGKIVDWEELRKEYEERKLNNEFKNLNWIKLKSWINEPRLQLQNDKGELIFYDKYVIRKTNYAILQMIFNEMDIYELNVGSEGSGKSCFSTQRILYYYSFLKDVGLIDYSLDVKRMYFSSINKILEKHDMENQNTKFEIECLDESNGLNRQNYREDESRGFKGEMRTERKNLRVMLLNMQQLGELDTSISLSRVNFIFYCDMDNEVKKGTLKKGNVDFVIIPRGKKIYSEKWKKEIYRSEIKERLSKHLESKSEYYKDIPQDIIVKSFHFEHVWGINKKEYDTHIKTENKTKRLSNKDLKLSDYVAYILLKKSPPLKNWDLDRKNPKDKKMYNTIAKFLNQIKYKLASVPEIEKRFNLIYGDDKE